MISPGHIGWPCTLFLRGKVNSLTVTGFPPDTYGMNGYIERDVTPYNNKQFQGLTSDTCGDYCLFYLFHRARNVDMDVIQAKFRSHDTQWNDAQVAAFVHSYLKSLTIVRQRSPFFQSEQT